MSQHFSGITIPVQGIETPVTVFIEEPSVEECTERKYPSVAVQYLIELNDASVWESDIEDQSEEISRNTSLDVHEASMRANPEPSVFSYSIDTWNKVRASESRDLLFQAVKKRVKKRGYLTVQNVDGENIDVWMFWGGGIQPSHERYPDEIIYHHSLTVDIHAYAAVVDATDTVVEKVAMEVQWDVSLK